jgi:Ni/Co efflux regulator RcnB
LAKPVPKLRTDAENVAPIKTGDVNMKKLILGTMAALVAAGPIVAAPAAAQDYRHHDRGGYNNHGNNHGYDNRGGNRGFRQWRRGDRFDSRYAQNYRRIDDWRAYRGRHLYAPPPGYYWARSGNDAILVAAAGGLIGAVMAGAFNGY